MKFYYWQLLALGCITFQTHARDTFNPAMLQIDNPNQKYVDLSIFEENGSQAPGIYRVDIYTNDQFQETREVTFSLVKNKDGTETLQPCLSVADLADMGVKTTLYPELGDEKSKCANLNAIPQAKADFRFSAQQLLLSIPQAAISDQARGYVPESQWDDGINALLLNYSIRGANSYARDENGSDSDSQYANLRPGINIGPWRIRNYTTWSRYNDEGEQWDTVYTYAQRNIIALKSQLILGDSSSPSDVFDSVPFRGGQLASDDDMLPDSLKGYAPVVRGIARSNAQVTIRQNGYTIYQSYVAPGAFEITDMFPTGGSGDLNVTIREADGSQQQFIVPFASLPVLQREGRLKYALTGGQYRTYDSSVDETPFGQGTIIYGLPFGSTVYGGAQFSRDYHSLALGFGKNFGDFGAVSTDVTHADSTMSNGQKDDGQSWRIRYSKNVVETGTNFAIAGYRYSTSGYYSMQEVLDTYRSDGVLPQDRVRNRTEMTISQTLWENSGSLSLSLLNEDYWDSVKNTRMIGVGYTNSWKGVSYGLNYSYNRNTQAGSDDDEYHDKDQIFSFNISMPLDLWSNNNTYASYSMNTSENGGTTNNVGLNGTMLADNNLTWSVQQGYASQGIGNSGNLNADHKGTYGEMNAGYAYDRNTDRLDYGLDGGAVIHANGVTLGQPLGETITLVQAPGAGGIGVINQTGVKTDYRGYALVPYISPFRYNEIGLNTETLPENVDVELTNQKVVPTRGAVALASFNANVGFRSIMTLRREQGEFVPFGATVNDPTKKSSQGFIVGDEGQVYVTGLADNGTLDVQWGRDVNDKCQVDYTVPNKIMDAGLVILTGVCK